MEALETGAPSFKILFVEDSPGDVRLTREALRDAKMHINLNLALEAIEEVLVNHSFVACLMVRAYTWFTSSVGLEVILEL
jgi:hypothetical protein